MMIKSFVISSIAVLMAGCYSTQQASKTVTAKFQVEGVCGMCEDRIETAAFIQGVRSAEWDLTSSMLTVIYAPKKVSEEAIHQSIAAAGHDTEKVKAEDAAYSKLPGCCAYRDGVDKH